MRAPAGPDEQVLMGIDVGGSKTSVGAIAFPAGEVLAKEIIPTPTVADSGAPFISRLSALAGTLMEAAVAAGWRCRGIGIGLCELVGADGEPASGLRVEWRGTDFRKTFTAIAPTVLETDIRAAALAEARLGSGRSHAQFVYVNLGTGISSCLVLDGVPYAGARGNALVLGCGPVPNVAGPQWQESIASSYVPEDIAGGAGLVARYRARSHAPAANPLSALDVIARAQAGDAVAREVVALGGKVAGSTIGLLVNILDPEVVIVGGGLGVAGGLYWDELLRTARITIWSTASRTVPILPTELGTDAALIGAALCATGTHSGSA